MKTTRDSEKIMPSISLLIKEITSVLMFLSILSAAHCHYTANPKVYYAHQRHPGFEKDVSKSLDAQQSNPIVYGSVVRSMTLPTDKQQVRHQQEPSCTSLRNLWKASMKEMSNKLGFFVFPNDLERILSNPYYRSLIRGSGVFGKIVTEASDSRTPTTDPVHGYERQFPGAFDDSPAERDEALFEHGVMSSDVAASPKAGSFGDIVVGPSLPQNQAERSHMMSEEASAGGKQKQTEIGKAFESSDQGSVYHSSTLARKHKSGNSNENSGTLSAAGDFFNSVWHDEPIKF